MHRLAGRTERLAMRDPADRPRRRIPPGLTALLAVLLAACQPLPHPFAADAPPPGSPILALPENTSVAIAPIQGGPTAVAEKLAPALASALQKREVAASARTTSLSSREIDGRIQQMPAIDGKAALVALWRLRGPSGHLIGEQAVRIEGTPREWQAADKAAIERIAAVSADRLAPLLQGIALKKPAAGGAVEAAAAPAAGKAAAARQIRVRIAGVTGAPGDGGQSLTRIIALLLQRRGIAIVSDPQAKADLVLGAAVAVAKPKGGKQHVRIVWHLRRSDGGEIGTVGQENDVPAGMLNGPWGDVAYAVAAAAQGGILQLVARGAPPPPAAAQGGTAAGRGKS